MKRWYVVQVYAGFEEQIKADLEKQVIKEGLESFIGEVLVPSAKMKRLFDVTEGSGDQQLFPGYILVELEAVPEALRLVQLHPRVVRFLGGKDPIPLSTKEIDRIKSQVRGEVKVSVAVVSSFNVGQEIEIVDGPFAGFVGAVERVDDEAEKMTVMVSIFGRLTPVELRFDQIKQ